MDHIERMTEIRKHVDTIIEQTRTLTALNYHVGWKIELRAYIDRGAGHPVQETALRVPVPELRTLIQRRINDADAAMRALGMVAPRPGPVSLAPTPVARDDAPSDTDTPPEEPS